MTKEAFFSKSVWQSKLKQIKMYLNSKNKVVRLNKRRFPKITHWIDSCIVESIQCGTNESIQNKSESVHCNADESIQYGTESILPGWDESIHHRDESIQSVCFYVFLADHIYALFPTYLSTGRLVIHWKYIDNWFLH